MPVEIGYFTLAVPDVEKGAAFYGGLFGWTFDAEGHLIDGLSNERVASAPIPSRESCLVVGAAMGARKLPAIRGALCNQLINGLVTDAATATALLA